MVEEINVKEWTTITYTHSPQFYIRLKNEGDILRIAQQYVVPFIFVRKNEKIVIHERCVYWYKP